jgi:hypothetical protein
MKLGENIASKVESGAVNTARWVGQKASDAATYLGENVPTVSNLNDIGPSIGDDAADWSSEMTGSDVLGQGSAGDAAAADAADVGADAAADVGADAAGAAEAGAADWLWGLLGFL